MTSHTWTRETVHENLLKDLIAKGKMAEILEKDTSKWVMNEFISDGGCNFLFLISDSKSGPYVIKWVNNKEKLKIQTSPFIKSLDIPLDQIRGSFEREYFLLNRKLVPESTPKVYFVDVENYYFCMEFFEGQNLKTEIIKGIKNDFISTRLGDYLAIKSFKTSNLYLDKEGMTELASIFSKNHVTRAFVDLYNFRRPYCPKYNDQHHKKVVEKLVEIQKDQEIKFKVAQLNIELSESIQCVTHGDFHTGSVLVKDDNIRIIDADTSTMGPMGYDIGILFGNLIVGYCFQDFIEKNQDGRKEIKKWIIKCVCEIWNQFFKKFIALWDEKKDNSYWSSDEEFSTFQSIYLKKVFQTTIGFFGIIVMRSAVESWPEYTHVKEEDKNVVSIYLIEVAKTIFKGKYETIEEVCDAIEKIKF